MSKERELLQRCLDEFEYKGVACNELCIDINKLLAQPEQSEQEPVTDKPTETAMAIMPNGVCVSNVYDAYEEGRKSVMVEQEPVAWMQDSIELYVLEEKSAIRGYVIPLYTAPPTREPLSFEDLNTMWCGNPIDFARRIESIHGIGEENE